MEGETQVNQCFQNYQKYVPSLGHFTRSEEGSVLLVSSGRFPGRNDLEQILKIIEWMNDPSVFRESREDFGKRTIMHTRYKSKNEYAYRE